MISINLRKKIDKVQTIDNNENIYECSECKQQSIEEIQCSYCEKQFQQKVDQLINFPIEFTQNLKEVFTNRGDDFYFSEDGCLLAYITKKMKDEVIVIFNLQQQKQLLEIVAPKSKILRHTSQIFFTFDNEYFMYKRQFGKEIDLYIYNIIDQKGKSFYFNNAQLQRFWKNQDNLICIFILNYITKTFEYYKIEDLNLKFQRETQSFDSFTHLIQGISSLSVGFFTANLSQLRLLSNLTLKQVRIYIYQEIYNVKIHQFNFLFIRPRRAEQKTLMNQISNNKIIRIINIDHENSTIINNMAIFQYADYNKNTILFYDFTKGLVEVQIILDNELITNIRSLAGYFVLKIQGIYKGWKIRNQE